ncbi:MAG TPA: LysE family transporter [Verrucomicrobiae bacterium]|jgi:threonine/homoserine/homoserine lactone efflux protein|nr:LysE family transporter [Verrucomicrobiae bacterium]
MIDAISPILLAMLTGLGAGLVLSMPVGPVNLTILNFASRRGFWAGMLVGLGASSMDLVYCAIAFTGFTQFFEVKMIKTLMEVFTFVFFLFIGAKFLRAQNLNAPTEFGATAHKLSARLDQKFKPQSAYMTGFVRVLGNFGVLLFWIVLAANLLAHDWVADTLAAKGVFIAGVALGTNAWFFGLSFTASRQCRQFSEPTLLRMERFSGVCLLGLGLAQGIHIAWQLAHHEI